MKSIIPVFSLEGSEKGSSEIHRLQKDISDHRIKLPHRDTNYILAFVASGRCELVVDFKKIKIEGPALFCILPGQIHYGTNLSGINAWILALDGVMIDPEMRQLLIESSIDSRIITLQNQEANLLEKSLLLLEEIRINSLHQSSLSVSGKMLDTCTSLFTALYCNAPMDHERRELRPAMISRSFSALVIRYFRTIKHPKDYASLLNISLDYLNEVVKDTTGFPVSYWILQEIIIEAKRLLYYTDNTVKEISISLGYSDVSYFNRLFRKSVGQTPLNFRTAIKKE